MTENEKFIEIYRRFEVAVRKYVGCTVKDYEDILEQDPERQGKIRICRLIRNYIEHENSAFVFASYEMISFLEKETCLLDDAETPVKKKMIPIRYAIRDNDLIIVAADFLTKRNAPMVPIFGSKNNYAIGLVSQSDIVKCVAAGEFSKPKKVASILIPHRFGFFQSDTPMKTVSPLIASHQKIYLVLNEERDVVGWIV